MNTDKDSTIPTHAFESALIDEAATGSGGRLPYEELLRQRETVDAQPFVRASDRAKNPVMYFNQQRQLLHANEAAYDQIIRLKPEEALGLRMGELFGCNHRMSTAPGEKYVCHDCNSMPSLRMALQGRQSVEKRHLVLHPEDRPIRAAFKISSVPMSAQGMEIAMMIFEKIDDDTVD